MPQSYFMPEIPIPSPVVVLAFLGTALLLAALFAAAVVALALRKRRAARWLSTAGLATAAAYMAVLTAVSLASRERILRKGDRKYFCEIDCHLAYSLEDIVRTKVADRILVAATVRSWFDERTIAPWRGDAPLTPNPRTVFVMDDSGRRYDPSPSGHNVSGRASTPLTRVLRPGESYTTTFIFELPASSRPARLFLGDAPGPHLFVIGHENSLLHKRIYFEM